MAHLVQWHRKFARRFVPLFFTVACAYALDPATPLNQYRITHWDNRSGLPQNGVASIAQTRDGYMWFGTQSGLARFDGMRFEHFIPATHPDLKDSLINSVAAAPDGALWVLTPQGLQRYKNGRFEPPVWGGDGRRLVTARLLASSDGAIWCNNSKQVLRYKNGNLQAWKRGAREELPEAAGMLREDRQGNVWLTGAEALYKFDGERFRRQSIVLPAGTIGDIAFPPGKMVVLVHGTGVVHVDLATGTTTKIQRTQPGIELGSLMVLDRHGKLWLLGRDTPLVRMDEERMEVLLPDFSLTPDVLFEDGEGSLWVSGLASGLVQLADTQVQNLASPEARRGTAWTVFEDHSKTLWIGFETGLSSYSGGRLRWVPELAGKRVTALAERPSGVVAATSKGVYEIGPAGVRLIDSDTNVRAMTQLRDGLSVWVTDGVWLRDSRGGPRRRIDDPRHGAWAPLLIPARDGRRFWVAGRGQLGSLNDAGELSTRNFGELSEVTGLVEDTWAGGRPQLWLCDFAGHLWLFREGVLTKIPLQKELHVIDAVSLLDDKMGRLWMGTSHGILVLSKADLLRAATEGAAPAPGYRVGVAHGMQNPECNTLTNSQSAIFARDGRLWFATEGGAAGIDPRRLARNPNVPSVHVEQLISDGAPQSLFPGPVVLDPGSGSLEFRYTGITMTSPELVRFRYWLEGFDRTPVEAGSRRSAFYTNLPPGDYRFVVEAFNSDGRDSGLRGTVAFTLRPRFYQTHLFGAISILTVFVVILATFRWRMHGIHARNAELESAVALRTAQLQEAAETARMATDAKSVFLTTMSHEIRTPINGVLGMTSLLLNTPLSAEASEYASAIQASGRALLSVINDILDFSKIESGKLELETAPFRLDSCVEEALDLLAPLAAAKGLDMAFSLQPDLPLAVCGDVTRLRQILLNLLGNAIKFTSAGEIAVSVSCAPGETVGDLVPLCFSVRDTGIGIPADRLDRLFASFSQVDSSTTRRFGGTGLGLAICRRLCELMGGSISVRSTEGVGSEFRFTVQLHVDHGQAPLTMAQFAARQELDVAGLRVLIVAEDTISRVTLANLLTLWGATVAQFSSASAALARLRQNGDYQVIVLAAQLPDADAIHVAASLRQMPLEAQPALVLLDRRRTSDNGPFSAILPWPVKPGAVVRVLRQTVRLQNEPEAQRHAAPSIDGTLGVRAPMRILLAEDNVMNQRVALRILEKMGYRADVAANGVEAIGALERQDYDLLLLDIQMPMVDGFEVARTLRARRPREAGPWIVALTANAATGDREICMEAGMDDYLPKPIDIASLQAALERAFRAISPVKQ